MAVDVKTLTIGSHILVNGKRERVRGLDEDNGLIIRFPAEYVMASDVEPIPLTSEFLEELGFEKMKAIFWQAWQKNGLYLAKRNKSSYWEYEGIRIQYLHELEALYYLIYEQELIKE